MSSRPVAPRRPARADAKRSIWPELSTCPPVPQHRADRPKRTAKPEHSAGVIYLPSPTTAPADRTGREAEDPVGGI